MPDAESDHLNDAPSRVPSDVLNPPVCADGTALSPCLGELRETRLTAWSFGQAFTTTALVCERHASIREATD